MLSNRNRGGIAAWAGHDYEQQFGVYRVIVAAVAAAGGSVVRLAPQLRGAVVDDWVEDVDGALGHFQLRRRKRALWSAVRAAFEKQRRLTPKSSLFYVVHLRKAALLLPRSRDCVPGVTVFHFPDRPAPQHHIWKPGPVRTALERACVLPSPTASDLERIWKELRYAWEKVRHVGDFRSVDLVLRELEDHPAALLRMDWAPTPAWRGAERVLATIPRLKVRVEDGVFFYSTGSGIKGRMSCRSSEFRNLLRRVSRIRPKSVSLFEGLL